MASGKFSEWSPYEHFVQSGLVDGQYLSGAFTMVAAGPPRLANIGGATVAAGALSGRGGDQIVLPLGVTQNLSLSNNKQFSRIFEIGSERSFHIAGRTVGQIGLSRILYHGPSLLRMMYAYYQDLIPPTVVPAVFPNAGTATMPNPHDVKIPPGYENLYLNLASDLFNQPIGLMLYMKDSNEDTVGAVYAEACFVPNHSWGTDAQGVIIQESVGVQFERIVPVAVNALSLITGFSS